MSRSSLRVIDANLNRAREALRVIEDHCRFSQNDPATSAAIKQSRHGLRSIVEIVGEDRLLAARSVESDVGRTLKAADENLRENEVDVVRAAFSRLAESLRSIAEYAKITHVAAAQIAETLRYESYALQQKIVFRDRGLEQLRNNGLYAILTESICRKPWKETARALIDGGVGCIQLREKLIDDRELLTRARWLREETAAASVLLCINDRADLAALCHADLLHVGRNDLTLADARKIVEGRVIIGTSTHTLEDLAEAVREHPDYVAIGPMFHSETKPRDALAGISGLQRVRAATNSLVAAIGGITLDRVRELRLHGADVICVCRDLLAAADPAAQTRRYREVLSEVAGAAPADSNP
ncbi:MAG: thiamine phosphate synthase [Phycisphaerae bacterium]